MNHPHNDQPPPLNPPPPTSEMAEPKRPTEIMPWWAALLLAVLAGAGHLVISAMNIREAGGGIGYSVGSLIGAMIFAPVIAGILSLAIKPLRSFTGFCLLYAGVSVLALLGALRA